MTTAIAMPPAVATDTPVTLHSGDRMSQAEFHRAYAQMPEDFKAELIGGVVYVASPLRIRHGNPHGRLAGLLFIYSARTLGTELADNVTVILGDESEPQPDLYLRVLPAYGGRSATTDDDYVLGGPELVLEVAHASRAIDLHAKRADYAAAGVPEYMVYVVEDRRLRWFDLAADRELAADADGVVRSRQFPGLWIDAPALAGGDDGRLMSTLEAGLATAAHADFAAALAARRPAQP